MNAPEIYNYLAETGEYHPLGAGHSYAIESPRERGVWLVPAHATTISPPTVAEHQIQIFNETHDSWSIVADYRGITYYDYDFGEHIITDIGVSPDPSWTLTPRDYTLQEQQQQKFEQIKAARDAGLRDPSATVATDDAIVWNADETSLNELNYAVNLYTAVGGVPSGVQWRDHNNTNHAATMSLLVAIGIKISQRREAIWQSSWSLKSRVNNATSIAALNSITIPGKLI